MQLAQALQPYNLKWVEECLPPDDYAGKQEEEKEEERERERREREEGEGDGERGEEGRVEEGDGEGNT